MNGKELFLGLSYINRKYIDEAENDTVNSASSIKHSARQNDGKHIHFRKLLLIAAVIALLLLLMGCAMYIMRLQHLTIQEETSGIPRETSFFNGEEINVISIQGFMGTDSYAAFQEWQEFLSAYDPDKSILHANNDFQRPDDYVSYSCYSQEMIDKIDEICEKYHLESLGKPWFFDRAEDVFEAVGIKSVFAENAQTASEDASGYCYKDGTFNIEGVLELTGVWDVQVSFDYRSVQKTSFDGVSRNIGNVADYDQWNYTMKNGQTVLLALAEDAGLIIVDKEDSFITVAALGVFANGSPFGNLPDERAFLEAFCEAFDFTFRTHPVDSSKADELYQAQLEREASGESAQVSGGLIDSEYLSSYAGWIDYMVDEMKYQDLKYALIDINGDGVEELLLQCEHLERYNGDPNSFFSVFTIKDGEIETIVRGSLVGSNYYLCEGGVLEQAYTNGHYYLTTEKTLESVSYSEGKWYKRDDWGSEGSAAETTEEEASAIIAKYPRVDIDFRPVEEYPAG